MKSRKFLASVAALGVPALLLSAAATAGTCSPPINAGTNWVDGTQNNPPAQSAGAYDCVSGPVGDQNNLNSNAWEYFFTGAPYPDQADVGKWQEYKTDNMDDTGEPDEAFFDVYSTFDPADPNADNQSATGYWRILGNFWQQGREAMIVLKDGGIPGGNTPSATWFAYYVTYGDVAGDWSYGNGKQLSHATLYFRDGPFKDVPEPGTLTLLGLGLLGLTSAARRRKG